MNTMQWLRLCLILIFSGSTDARKPRLVHHRSINPQKASSMLSLEYDEIDFTSSTTAENQTMIASEISIVSDFYWATGGSTWLNSYGWNQLEEPSSHRSFSIGDNKQKVDTTFKIDPCYWYGITCNDEGNTIELVITHNNMTGTLPASLVNLTKLQKLDFQYNAITSTIPNSFCGWRQLYELGLRSNHLTGLEAVGAV
jgi:hypothetical protein